MMWGPHISRHANPGPRRIGGGLFVFFAGKFLFRFEIEIAHHIDFVV
jgi:hypothetical protein